MNFDVAMIDELLMTTRSVRKRLDFDRDVDDETILDCIDVAEQAPTGGNQGSRRWLVIRDPALKEELGKIYLEGAGQFMIGARDRTAGTGHPQERTMASSAYLAENLAKAPAIVIPTIIGEHDGSGRPGLFDSVIQSGWSFCLALRARGLGTTWVTAVFADLPRVKDLLSIPEGMTEIVMFPIAYTKGMDFQRAPRYPAREITYFDGFARTYESGPSNPVSLVDGPGTIVEIDIGAKPARVWELVSDINLPALGSNEFLGAKWVDEPGLGAKFVGTNTLEAMGGEWDVECFVDAYEQNRSFGWRTSNPEDPGARWRFDIEPIAGASRLRFSLNLGPGFSGLSMFIAEHPDKEHKLIRNRISHHNANMQATIEAIKQAAESSDM